MIDITKAKIAFKEFLTEYKNENDTKYDLKIIHTYHVAEKAKEIAKKLHLSSEEIELAELIALLHDIGRFEELKILEKYDSVNFDHATYGSRMLFEQGLIRKFIEDKQYDEIIKKAIENHSKLSIEDNLDERTLLHAKIIRDADKLDNIRVKKEEKIEEIFPNLVNKKEEIESSTITDTVYETILSKKCVDIHDRVTPLDFWICVLAFTFDLNFDVSYKIVKDNNDIDILIDRFKYTNKETKEKMEKIRKILNEHIAQKIN